MIQTNYPTPYKIVDSDPASASEGTIVFNKTDDTLRVYYGGSWHTINGGGGSGGVEYDDMVMSDPDANGNYQTVTLTNGGSTVMTLDLTYDGNSLLTDAIQTVGADIKTFALTYDGNNKLNGVTRS